MNLAPITPAPGRHNCGDQTCGEPGAGRSRNQRVRSSPWMDRRRPFRLTAGVDLHPCRGDRRQDGAAGDRERPDPDGADQAIVRGRVGILGPLRPPPGTECEEHGRDTAASAAREGRGRLIAISPWKGAGTASGGETATALVCGIADMGPANPSSPDGTDTRAIALIPKGASHVQTPRSENPFQSPCGP